MVIHTIRIRMLVLVVLVFVGVVFARPLVILAADANDCLVWSVDPNVVPYLAEIGDVNESWGRLLPPAPGDVNDWDLACGKFQRTAARACDPEEDSFTITYLSGTSPATVFYESNEGTWWFTAEVLRGVNLWRFRATDAPLYAEPASSNWWITCYGLAPQNTAPVLQ